MAIQAVSHQGDNVELQSVRGLAAIIVLTYHSLIILKAPGASWFVANTLLNSHGAVVLFFVLSGFVLASSLTRRGISGDEVGRFYVRRLFRIYPALWIGVCMALAVALIAPHLSAPHQAPRLVAHFAASPPTTAVLGAFAGVDSRLLLCLWTITVELAASAVLPLLVWIAMKGRDHGLALLMALAAITMAAGQALHQIPLYMADFGFGIVLATAPSLTRLNPGRIGTAVAAAVLLWGYLLLPGGPNGLAVRVLLEGAAAFFLIAGLFNANARWLRAGSLVRLGDWSYSLYLVHLPIALLVSFGLDAAGLMTGSLAAWPFVIAALTLAITLPVAALLYRFIELPGMALGKRVLAIRLAPIREGAEATPVQP